MTTYDVDEYDWGRANLDVTLHTKSKFFDGRRMTIRLLRGLNFPWIVFEQNPGEKEEEFKAWKKEALQMPSVVDYEDELLLNLEEQPLDEALLMDIIGVLNKISKRIDVLGEDSED